MILCIIFAGWAHVPFILPYQLLFFGQKNPVLIKNMVTFPQWSRKAQKIPFQVLDTRFVVWSVSVNENGDLKRSEGTVQCG